MPVDSCHPYYDEDKETLCRMRDFLEGERCVKAAGRKYLPQLGGQDDLEYTAYKQRATFLNASARTHAGMVGLVFRKDPLVVMPGDVEILTNDADMAGVSIYGFMRRVMSEVLAVGRLGILVDWSDEEQRPYFTTYDREAILNWRYARFNGRVMLSMVVLLEKKNGPAEPLDTRGRKEKDDYVHEEDYQIRVLRLVRRRNRPVYTVELYEKQNVGSGKGKTKRDWVLTETREPKRRNQPMQFLPFIFADAEDKESPRPPLDDLVALNENHYRTSADHKHGLHFSALPTAWVAGFDVKAKLKIGSQEAWVTENPEARAGFLEFTGAGMGAIREELDRLETSMAVMGARLLEQQKREAETAEAMHVRQVGESSILTYIVGGVAQRLTEALKVAYWWAAAIREEIPNDVEDEVANIALNTDFLSAPMSATELTGFVSAWIQQGISRRTLFDNLKRGEVIPENRTYEEELELIGEGGPDIPSPPLDDAES